MKVFHLFIVMIFSYALLSLPLLSQEKWGKVSKEILAMDKFEADTTAPAVILFDVVEKELTDKFIIKTNRHVRIKILTEQGKSFADIEILYYPDDNLDDIEAHSISPAGKKTKLDKKNIFEEDINQYWKKKVFAIPGVEVGSVIEYKYKQNSEYLHILRPWYFQNECYTQVSEFSIKLFPRFSYNVFYQNIIGDDAEPVTEDYLIPGLSVGKGRKFTWRIENIPPVTHEPYMKNIDDYRMAVFFQLLEYKGPYSTYKFIAEWDDLAETVYDSYEDYFDRKGDLKRTVEELCPDTLLQEQKLKILYAFVRDEIESQYIYGIYVDRSPQEVLKKRSADLSDKNMFLISLLQHAGIEAYPLLISTRSSGIVQTYWPQLRQFNLTLAYAVVNGMEYFLDANEKFCPCGSLPEEDLVDIGFLIRKEDSKFVRLPQPNEINMLFCQTMGRITNTGDLSCTANIRYEGYQAMDIRKKLETSDQKEFISTWLSDEFSQVSLDTFQVANLENLDVPLQIHLKFTVNEYAQVIGDMIYLTPPQLYKFKENPFKSEVRNFPVDYPYLVGVNEDVTLLLPDGYAVEELPPFKILKMDGCHFMCDSNQDENKISFKRQYLVKKLCFQPYEYDELRNLHSRIVNLEESQIVLKSDSGGM